MSENKRQDKEKSVSGNIGASMNPVSDDFNIKSNLNTSLEWHGITVTQELIDRTLQAVKEHEIDETEDQNNQLQKEMKGTAGRKKKSIGWYRNIRTMAGAAAAVIILVAGYQFISGLGSYTAKNASDSTDSLISQENAAVSPTQSGQLSDSANDFAGTTDGSSLQGSDNGTYKSAETPEASVPQDTGTGASAKVFAFKDEAGTGAADNAASKDTNQQSDSREERVTPNTTKEPGSSQKGMTATETPEAGGTSDSADRKDLVQGIAPSLVTDKLTLQDILAVSAEEISSIRITDDTNGKLITLTSREDIQSFYTKMKEQQFTEGTQPPTIMVDYTIAFTNSQGMLYTLTIADTVTVSPATGNGAGLGFYSPVDLTALLKLIAGYFNEQQLTPGA